MNTIPYFLYHKEPSRFRCGFEENCGAPLKVSRSVFRAATCPLSLCLARPLSYSLLPLDWNRHEKNTYKKIIHWFEGIGKVLQDPIILPENVYNMDESGVMLSIPGAIKVLIGKDDIRDYRGARVKRTTVTAIECISADSRYLTPMIIWLATTHRSNWTIFPTPGWQYACSESGYTDSKISLEWLK